jgi:predicted CXXCH cytochrome family protein
MYMVSWRKSNNQPSRNPADGRSGTGRIVLLVMGCVLVSQCSVSRQNLLSFFFDGVPGLDNTELQAVVPDSIQADTSLTETEPEGSAGLGMVFHAPYREKLCDACHDPNSLGELLETQPGLCYSCHEDFHQQFGVLHGPVDGGYCTSCHDPHMAKWGGLLKYEGDRLCLYCHWPDQVYAIEIHQDLDGMACMDCHNPHGGEDKYLF